MASTLLATSSFSQNNDTDFFYILYITDSSTIENIINGDTIYASYVDTFYSPVWYSYDSLSINEVTAKLHSCGPFFFNIQDSVFTPKKYVVPNTIENAERKYSIFSHNVWLGGIAESGALHLSSESYRQSGESFWHGPIADTYDNTYDQTYNKVWKIDKDSIDYHIANYTSQDYIVPQQIQQWPANGNTQNGEAESLAPYYNVAGSWMYEPELGDYPKIEGDQALFVMFNDDRIEPYSLLSSGNKIGAEIHALFYAFDCDEVPSLNQSTFINYTIYNRSVNNYTDFKIGINTDFDIGNKINDYIGCDTTLNMYYCYSESEDNSNAYHYGQSPPAIGVKFLNNEIKNFLFYSNNMTYHGNPRNAHHVYNFMHSKWKNDSLLTFGEDGTNSNNPTTNFMYSSNPNDTTGWSMYQANITPSDMRGVGSLEDFTFESGSHVVVNTAIIFAWDSTVSFLENADLLFDNSALIQDFYDGLITTNCTEFSGNQEVVDIPMINPPQYFSTIIYPNPTADAFYLQSDYTGLVTVFNSLGQAIYSEEKIKNKIQVKTKHWTKGVYFVKVGNEVRKLVTK